MPGRQPAQQRPEGDRPEGGQVEQEGGVGLVQALRLAQPLDSPDHGEHVDAEPAGEVHPEAQPGGWMPPRRRDPAWQVRQALLLGPGPRLSWRGVADPQCGGPRCHDADQGRAQEGPQPAPGVEQRQQEHRRRHLPHLTQQTRQLGQNRDSRRAEPGWEQAQHRAVQAGITQAKQDPRAEREGQDVGEGHDRLGCHQHRRSADHYRPRPVAVHQHTDGGLRDGVGRQLHHDEGGDDADAGPEMVRGLLAQHSEAGALHDGGRVGENPDDPDQPGQSSGLHHLCTPCPLCSRKV